MTGVLTDIGHVRGARRGRPDRRKRGDGVRILKQTTDRMATTRVVKRQALQTGTDKMSDVAERVKKIVIEHLGVEPEKVVTNANFIDDLGADSLDTVELVMAFEEEFGVEIPDDAAEKITTFGDAVTFLEKAQAA